MVFLGYRWVEEQDMVLKYSSIYRYSSSRCHSITSQESPTPGMLALWADIAWAGHNWQDTHSPSCSCFLSGCRIFTALSQVTWCSETLHSIVTRACDPNDDGVYGIIFHVYTSRQVYLIRFMNFMFSYLRLSQCFRLQHHRQNTFTEGGIGGGVGGGGGGGGKREEFTPQRMCCAVPMTRQPILAGRM